MRRTQLGVVPADLHITGATGMPVGPSTSSGGTSTILILGALGVAGYLVYRHFKKG